MPPAGHHEPSGHIPKRLQYVLTYISIMLRHINYKKLYMSILFSTFVVEIRNISQTPKKQRL